MPGVSPGLDAIKSTYFMQSGCTSHGASSWRCNCHYRMIPKVDLPDKKAYESSDMFVNTFDGYRGYSLEHEFWQNNKPDGITWGQVPSMSLGNVSKRSNDGLSTLTEVSSQRPNINSAADYEKTTPFSLEDGGHWVIDPTTERVTYSKQYHAGPRAFGTKGDAVNAKNTLIFPMGITEVHPI